MQLLPSSTSPRNPIINDLHKENAHGLRYRARDHGTVPGFYRSLCGVDIHRRHSFIGAYGNKTEDKGVHRALLQDNATEMAIPMAVATATAATTVGGTGTGVGICKTLPWMVIRAVAGGQSSKIDEHDKSSGSDTGLNDSTRQLTDLRIQCIEFLFWALCCTAERPATRHH